MKNHSISINGMKRLELSDGITPMFFNVFYTNKRVIMQPLEFLESIKRKQKTAGNHLTGTGNQ